METPSHCTVSSRRTPLSALWLAVLTCGVLLVHGYHPWAEDGGLYVAGVEYTLNPSLFPHQRAFVTEQLGYSLFAPAVAALVRLSHLSLPTVLFCLYLVSIALTLFAAHRIARACFTTGAAGWTGVTFLSASWTLPVAGTSLLLMDPYVSARSLSTPLSLLAVAAALEAWPSRRSAPGGPAAKVLSRPLWRCTLALFLAALFHPLMAGYALGLVLLLRFAIEHRRRHVWIGFALLCLAAAAALQLSARAESAAAIAAAYSRYYWFLSQWHWFEWVGILAPPALFLAFLRRGGGWLSPAGRAVCRACIGLALIATLVALIFGREHLQAHAVARLQPLRAFLLIYALLFLFCGAALAAITHRLSAHSPVRAVQLSIRALPVLVTLAMAGITFRVQRASFPASIHLELPGRANPNPWVQAFLWAHDHTPPDAVFALDARYVNTYGEDAQIFRAIAERSAIPDFSKDGGEAANTPRLAPEWQRSAQATANLSDLSDQKRADRLRPFAVQWLILHTNATTAAPCPYRNAVVKVCRFDEAIP